MKGPAPETSPLVSIGLAVYNGASYLETAIESLLAQDYPNLEIIISDNASTDATAEICRRHVAENQRVSYYRNDFNQGAIANFNRVFELAGGEFFTWASHDDRRQPGHIIACVRALQAAPDVLLAGTACEVRDADCGDLLFTDPGFSTTGLTPAARYKLYKTTLHGGSHVGGIFYGVYRRQALAALMPMPLIIGADNLIPAGLALAGDLVTIPQALIVKHWGGASMSHRRNAQTIGLTNPLMIAFPYLVREFHFQRLIRRSDQLSSGAKLNLSLWSWWHYKKLALKLAAFKLYDALPEALQGPVKRLLKRG